MKRILAGSFGLLAGATFGWLAFGTIPGAIGLGCAVAASVFGLVSRPND